MSFSLRDLFGQYSKLTNSDEGVMWRQERFMLVLKKKQKVVIRKGDGHSLIIIKGLVSMTAHLPTLKWEDDATEEKGDGKDILAHLARIEKKRLVKGNDSCRVRMKRGALAQSPHLKNQNILKFVRITFLKS